MSVLKGQLQLQTPCTSSRSPSFAKVSKKMSQHTQFMFASHNKITIEMAQQLLARISSVWLGKRGHRYSHTSGG